MAHVKRSRWRWVWRGVVALCVGVVVTYGVAWGFAAYGQAIAFQKLTQATSRWGDGARNDRGVAPEVTVSQKAFGMETFISTGYGQSYASIYFEQKACYGYPLLGLQWIVHSYRSPLSLQERDIDTGPWNLGIAISESQCFGNAAPFYPRRLPLRPVWPAFMANVSVYATCFAIAQLGVGVVRRRFRTRPEGCQACGYDVGGLAGGVCPECGGSTLAGSR